MTLELNVRVLGNSVENRARVTLSPTGSLQVDFEKSNTSMRAHLSKITFSKPSLPDFEPSTQVMYKNDASSAFWKLNIPESDAEKLIEGAEKIKSTKIYQDSLLRNNS